MSRIRLFATATLMALTFNACDEGAEPTPPPPPPPAMGTISGTVTIEGAGASGITAALSSGATTTTGAGGNFSFAGVEAGSYTVTISGAPDDVTFPNSTQAATIASDGQTVSLNFAGQYIRSSSVAGSVMADGDVLSGVTVTLDGEHAMSDPQSTGMDGGFAFSGLRAGSYTVTISGFPEDVEFPGMMATESMTVDVGVGDVGEAMFDGHYIRSAGVQGSVVVEGEGFAGVTVDLTGGPEDAAMTTTTDGSGQYSFAELRPGDYEVAISGYDPEDLEFDPTSQSVSVALGETATVPFSGVLLRTSGITGRVSVEGMGLEGISVTLSAADMDDMTATTDAGGTYAFGGLAAGDFTVAISVESAAYVFASMSQDVTVADDENAIVNFEGMHARTASVFGMLFIDEGTKNDMHDEGEHPLPATGVPVVLVGPDVNDQMLGATDANGQFAFTGLQAANYQLVVAITADVAAALAAAGDFAYGGSATGYPIALGVGATHTQNLPFDITHTTVNFTVSLKSGDETGDAVPGAAVTLYSDAAGETRVGGGETGDDGSVAIKVARAATSGNMVHAGVSVDGYDVADGMTAVPWNPQYNMTAGANANDIVNLNVDVTVSGATVTTDYGGGDALKGWAISVMSGEDAVEGAPEALDDDGNAAFTTTVDAVPATFSFAAAEDQDDDLDGGESYDAGAVEYTHTGLSLAGTMAAGTIEVAYTTQTLKVYVHQEQDQVMGYTGNILGGDARVSGMVDVGIRYLDDAGRSRAFTRAQWNSATPGNKSDRGGLVTFAHVPAAYNVIVTADELADGIKLLDPDELATFRNMEDNGVTGGAFGAMGGFSHTVELCPLQATEPAGQDHGECASFAFVTTHTVSGLVWKSSVTMDAASDGFEFEDPDFVAGISVDLSPVEGKNLAGDVESYVTAATDVRNTPLDETHEFSFGGVAAGVYSVDVPSGWRYRMGAKGSEEMVGGALSPLAGDVVLDVTPSTATLYGRVTGTDGFALDNVTVTANDVSSMTDALGRYILEGITPETRRISNVTHTNMVFLQASAEGYGDSELQILAFEANKPGEQDIDLAGVGARATISGTVRASGTNAPVAGVLILVDGETPTNAPTRGANAGKLLTEADGSYTAIIAAKGLGTTAMVSASKAGMSFQPPAYPVAAHAGADSRADFTGYLNATVSGRVIAPGGGPQVGATLTATSTAPGATAADEVTTGVTGTFALSVPFGSYTIEASLANHIFDYPATGQVVNVAPGLGVNFGAIQAKTAMALNVSAVRQRGVDDDDDSNGDETQTWLTTILVTYTADAESVPVGREPATYAIQTATDGADDDWTAATATAVEVDGEAVPGRFTIPSPRDSEFMVRVVATAANDADVAPDFTGDDATLTLESGTSTVAEIDPSTSGVTARRQAAADSDEGAADGNFIYASWNAVTDDDSQFRVVAEVTVASVGADVWVILSGTTALEDTVREWNLEVADDYSQSLTTLGGASITVTADDLNNEDITVRVDARQDGVDEGEDGSTDTWTEERQGAGVVVVAKPDDG